MGEIEIESKLKLSQKTWEGLLKTSFLYREFPNIIIQNILEDYFSGGPQKDNYIKDYFILPEDFDEKGN